MGQRAGGQKGVASGVAARLHVLLAAAAAAAAEGTKLLKLCFVLRRACS